MSGDVVAERVRSFVGATFRVAGVAAIGDDDDLFDAGIVDSMGVLTLVDFVEESFGFTVADDELVPENFASVSAMADFVRRRTGAADGRG